MNPISVIFFGTPDFAVPSLQALLDAEAFSVRAVVTQPDKPAGRGQKLRASPVKEMALQHAIPVLQPKSLRKELDAFLASVAPYGPFDTGVVVAFGQILPPQVLNLPAAGCVNVHGSLLPRWRGAAPIQRAVMSGDRETGICLMQMDQGLDTGAVFDCVRTEITASDSTGTLHDRLAGLGAGLLAKRLPEIVSGTLQAVSQPMEGVTYAAKITSEEQRIVWDQEAAILAHQIMGLSPFPGAWTTLDGKRVKILSAEATSTQSGSAPGTIVGCHGAVEAACASGTVLIRSLQLEGKRAMSAEEFLRGHAEIEGQRFV